jgi:hypothetical protein
MGFLLKRSDSTWPAIGSVQLPTESGSFIAWTASQWATT